MITINEGTQTGIYATSVGGTQTQVVRIDIGSGTTPAEFGGTISRVTDLLKGTLTSVTNLAFGTVDSFYRHPDGFATVVSSGTSTMGTIKAGVAGSAIYVTDLVVSAGTATNVEIGNGGTNLSLIGTLHLNTNGGAVMNFRSPIFTSAGSALIYKQSANGALTITCQGYVD